MSSNSLVRAATASGVWLAAAWGLTALSGVSAETSDLLMDAGILGPATLGADIIHGMLNLQPTTASSAIVTGGLYAGSQRAYRGDTSYVSNFAGAAANDVAVDWIANTWGASGNDDMDSDNEVALVATAPAMSM